MQKKVKLFYLVKRLIRKYENYSETMPISEERVSDLIYLDKWLKSHRIETQFDIRLYTISDLPIIVLKSTVRCPVCRLASHKNTYVRFNCWPTSPITQARNLVRRRRCLSSSTAELPVWLTNSIDRRHQSPANR